MTLFSRISPAVWCAVLLLTPPALARPVNPAPLLPPPSGKIVRVSTEAELQAAVRRLASNTTILVSPGIYRLTNTLQIAGTLTNVGYAATAPIGTAWCSRAPG